MKFCLLEGLYRAERYPVVMGLHHDHLAHPLFEPEHPHQGLDNMVHGVHVVIMQKDPVAWYGCGLPISGRFGARPCHGQNGQLSLLIRRGTDLINTIPFLGSPSTSPP
jgi:hypothetical protein